MIMNNELELDNDKLEHKQLEHKELEHELDQELEELMN
jgi:hypothetical protein